MQRSNNNEKLSAKRTIIYVISIHVELLPLNILTKEEGGRHTPFFQGYRPQFYVRTTDVTGKIDSFQADDGTETQMVMPGDRIKMVVQLIQPIAIEKGMRFASREGGRTVGAGVVFNILD